MKTKVRGRIVAALLSCGLLFGSGLCVPDNFWANLWANTAYSAAETAVDFYVLDYIEAALIPAG